MAVIPGTHISDVSEFQAIDWDAYARVRNAAIIRVAYGTSHDDNQWAHNQQARDGRLRACGIYGYLVATQDPAAQANHWCDLVGHLGANEFFALDYEESGDGGDQTARAVAALDVLDQRLGRSTWFYSYAPFIQAHIVLSSLGNRRLWIAGYGPEPAMHHDLWQHTNGTVANHECQPSYPGAPACDCSVFPGPVDQLVAMIQHDPAPAGDPQPPPPSVTIQGDPDVASLQGVNISTNRDGNGDTVVNLSPDVVLALTPNGSDPEAHGGAYSPIPRVSKSAFNGQTKIEVEGGPPNAVVLVWVTVAAPTSTTSRGW